MPDFTEDFLSTLERMKRDRQDRLTRQRQTLRGQLQTLGVTEVEAAYDACGGSGNVERVEICPSDIAMDDALERALADFVWEVAYDQHPGFENNDGGFGQFTWDMGTDSITLDHADRVTRFEHTLSEGI